MPNRFVSLAILIVWAYASYMLFRRDIAPALLIGPPPDLRVIAEANESPQSTRWSILVADDEEAINLRSVGQVETTSRHSRDGWLRLQSLAWFDSKELLKGTPLETPRSDPVQLHGVFDIDNRGNLESFRAGMAVGSTPEDVVVLAGTVRGNELEVISEGPVSLLNWTRSFPYEPRELVQSPMSPLERIPGLQVGQRWSSRMVSPLTGRVEQMEVFVERRRVITWDSNPVTTFEVVSRAGLISARTWVRVEDGLVLRQEAPLPLVRIVLERIPERLRGSYSRSEASPP